MLAVFFKKYVSEHHLVYAVRFSRWGYREDRISTTYYSIREVVLLYHGFENFQYLCPIITDNFVTIGDREY